MKILITGSSGFVGSRLSEAFRKEGHTVTGADFVSGVDISDWNSAKEIPEFDICYHLAAKSYVPDSYLYPHEFYRVNCNGTLNMLELCRLYKAKMVFVSSYVYGIPEYLPIDENHPVKPFNPYAQTKIVGEKLCEGYNRDFNLPVLIVRPFNLYGLGQNPNFLIPTIISQLDKGKIKIKDPKPKRDFVYIDDFIDLLLTASKKDYLMEIVNAASGSSYSVLEIVSILLEINGLTIPLEIEHSDRKSEIADTLGSFEKALQVFNWSPKISLYEGLSAYINSWRNKGII